MESIKLEAGKFYRTREGKKAFVSGECPFNVAKSHYKWTGWLEGNSSAMCWAPDGSYVEGRTEGEDLVAEWAEPKRIKGWVAIGGSGFDYLRTSNALSTKEKALAVFEADYSVQPLACIEIDVLEGEGL